MIELSPSEMTRRLMTPEEKAQEEFFDKQRSLRFDWRIGAEDIIKKHTGWAIPFGEAEKTTLSNVVSLVTQTRKIAEELAQCDKQIQDVNWKIDHLKTNLKHKAAWVDSATLAFRNAIPDILTLKIYDAPEYNKYNENYSICDSPNKLDMIKSFAKINAELSEIDKFKAEIANQQEHFKALSQQRQNLADTLTELLHKTKKLLPKLEPMFEVIEITEKKQQAACDNAIKELKKSLAKEYPADVVQSVSFNEPDKKLESCVGNLILANNGNFQRYTPQSSVTMEYRY